MSQIIGITGGIASGKSMVVELIGQAGYQVIDADEVVHDLQQKGGKLYEALLEAFGYGILNVNGELERAKLSEMIFSKPENLEKSSRVQNVIIRQELVALRDQMAGQEEVFFMDIPLLMELDYLDWFDAVWLVYVDHKTQLKRLMARNHLSEEEARQRINSQWSLDDKKPYADLIIDNNGSKADLENQVKLALRNLAKE
ncbi:dephospho-CoA kinase [Streptococcus didelphis]|uniref:Dephospho-CoA kinase n=1 Tax=Streptococcus didelphis TaxID=102886 RepID=A0ABY9LIS9_9STRE|nr:dephospho-CoA kinase [Streptococcus didelphis]WMB28792.1 dephospho-CoA kinase [Streptococcus didelphis]WMB29162.1 dephospho-CoA kinase [Streptococcus didelphis]